ncbi:hypothetical protein [Brevibacillus reuszeri]|uniref:hypothetical protein n=1 Tax=Brevibacillus reuszeri TaxID=54915 RepID=UPI000CCC6281|nr:hypothetical protein [Brevibacillus reuszeri]
MSKESAYNPLEDVLQWYSWLKTIPTIQADRQTFKQASMKLPTFPDAIFIHLENLAKEQLDRAQKILYAKGIRILLHKYEQGEYFLVWQYKGEKELTRLQKKTLAVKIHENMALLTKEITSVRPNIPDVYPRDLDT